MGKLHFFVWSCLSIYGYGPRAAARESDGRTSVALYAKDRNIWLNQSQITELFATSKQTISHHIGNILYNNELEKDLVVKCYLTTASDGKEYNVE